MVNAARSASLRQIVVAGVVAVIVGVSVGVATVLIPNQVFGRDIPPVIWNYPVLVATALLSGLLAATYVDSAPPPTQGNQAQGDQIRPGRFGIVGVVASWFAVGCPVCNKFALMAFGYAGAQTWFAPLQPILAFIGIGLLFAALAIRLQTRTECPRLVVAGGEL